MSQQSKAHLASALEAIYEMHNKVISKAVVNIWWHLVKQRGVESVLKALTEHTMSPAGKFLPKPADIIEILDGTQEDAALMAWTKFHNALRNGSHVSVCFDDVLINQVAKDLGGWIAFGQLTAKDITFKEKEFVRLYQMYMKNPPLNPPGHLIGVSEKQNSTQGYPSPEPIMIGNREKALENYKALPAANSAVGLVKQITDKARAA